MATADVAKAVNLKRAQAGVRRGSDTSDKNSPSAGTSIMKGAGSGGLAGGAAGRGAKSNFDVGGQGGGQRDSRILGARAEAMARDLLEKKKNEKTVMDRARGKLAEKATQATITYFSGGTAAPVAKIAGKVAKKVGESKVGRWISYGLIAVVFTNFAIFIFILIAPIIVMCALDQMGPSGGGLWGGVAKGVVSGVTGFGAVKPVLCPLSE